MMKRLYYLFLICCIFSCVGCSNANTKVCPSCFETIAVDSSFCPHCGVEIIAVNPSNSLEEKPSTSQCESKTTSSTANWFSCPVSITGGISGSSGYETISLRIENVSNKDIDSAKFLVSFVHTNHDNVQELITSVHSVDTIWSDDYVNSVISGEYYNFSTAEIFPVCVYFKDGSKWGDSSATYETLLKYTRPFYIEHFALTSPNIDEANPNEGLQGSKYDYPSHWSHEIDDIPVDPATTTERNLDGIIGYTEDVEKTTTTTSSQSTDN